jgi:hypothetical protein
MAVKLASHVTLPIYIHEDTSWFHFARTQDSKLIIRKTSAIVVCVWLKRLKCIYALMVQATVIAEDIYSPVKVPLS